VQTRRFVYVAEWRRHVRAEWKHPACLCWQRR